jgi:hypothetical protein
MFPKCCRMFPESPWLKVPVMKGVVRTEATAAPMCTIGPSGPTARLDKIPHTVPTTCQVSINNTPGFLGLRV